MKNNYKYIYFVGLIIIILFLVNNFDSFNFNNSNSETTNNIKKQGLFINSKKIVLNFRDMNYYDIQTNNRGVNDLQVNIYGFPTYLTNNVISQKNGKFICKILYNNEEINGEIEIKATMTANYMNEQKMNENFNKYLTQIIIQQIEKL